MSLPLEHFSPFCTYQLLQMKQHLSALHTDITWLSMSMKLDSLAGTTATLSRKQGVASRGLNGRSLAAVIVLSQLYILCGRLPEPVGWPESNGILHPAPRMDQQDTFCMQGKELLVFERFMNFRKTGGNHCQLNVIAVSAKAAAGAAATAQKAAQGHGLSLQPVPRASKVWKKSSLPLQS